MSALANLKAFLDMLAVSEGTSEIGDQGYNCIVGSRVGRAILFTDYSDHPRVKVQLRKDEDGYLWSTAAGRYQILARYFDAYKRTLKLPDFSPASQDAIAVQMLREQRALKHIEEGRFDKAVDCCRNIWASLPGAGYGQHENTLSSLRDVYVKRGGTISQTEK